MSSSSKGLMIYRALTRMSGPAAKLYLWSRVKRGKEDRKRLKERFGHAGQTRPHGLLVWIHAASVGESVSVLPVIGRLQKTHYSDDDRHGYFGQNNGRTLARRCHSSVCSRRFTGRRGAVFKSLATRSGIVDGIRILAQFDCCDCRKRRANDFAQREPITTVVQVLATATNTGKNYNDCISCLSGPERGCGKTSQDLGRD
ncbi:MAG TPA: hypothetical protein EYQ81_01455 [Sneathiellales bacterium]|nr:hypothetical protein [Sneathiellales bacterium]